MSGFKRGPVTGTAWRGGKLIGEVTDVQFEVPVTPVGYQPGKETRSGTIRLQRGSEDFKGLFEYLMGPRPVPEWE